MQKGSKVHLMISLIGDQTLTSLGTSYQLDVGVWKALENSLWVFVLEQRRPHILSSLK